MKPTVIYGESDYRREELEEHWRRVFWQTPEGKKRQEEYLKRAAEWYDFPTSGKES